ncbi:LysR substrate-binding domain-containing protein [Clavibacter tessellarius]|uniref:LysR substrate-binding domain-containing protein n=1 Tax=Clavibacter tessellarius TaxID=31965 RepID=UPI00324518AF
MQVAILPKEHAHATADAVSLTDLAEDLLLQPADEVPGWPGRTAGADPVPMPADVAAAVELVAAGVGFVVVPHALGRLHARKDVVAVPVHDLPETRIAVAWREGDASPHIEEPRGHRPRAHRRQLPVGARGRRARPPQAHRRAEDGAQGRRQAGRRGREGRRQARAQGRLGRRTHSPRGGRRGR